MSKGQQQRAEVVNRVLSGAVSKDEAEMLLGLSRRQINRVLNRYRDRGMRSIVHGNTGRGPVNKTSSIVAQTALSVVEEGGKYHGFNVCHIHDLLWENEGISLGRSTLDRILRRDGVISSRRKRKLVRRKRRERCGAEGSMLQIDGSPHTGWRTEGRRCAL